MSRKSQEIIIEHRFTGNPSDFEKAADAAILVYRALGILSSNSESKKLAQKLEIEKTRDLVS